MIPWYYAAITAGIGSLVGAVLMVIYYRKYSSLAEQAEELTAAHVASISDSLQQVADSLKRPGK